MNQQCARTCGRHGSFIAALAVWAAAAPAFAQEADPGGFGLQSLNPDLAFIADLSLSYFSAEEPLQTGEHDPHETGFALQQLELSVGKGVDPYFRFDGNIVFSPHGVEIEEVYATTLALPFRLQLRLGQFLTRFGRANATHPHTWDFVDQPFALGRLFGGEGNRGVGVEASWLTPLPWFVEVVGSVTDGRGGETARSFLGESGARVTSPLDFQLTGAVKQFFDFGDDVSLLWGLSAANGPNGAGEGLRTGIYGTDLYLKYRPISVAGDPTELSLEAEVFYRRRRLPGAIAGDLNGFAQLFWRFAKRWGAAARYEYGQPALVLGPDRGAFADPLDPDWTADRHRVSANLTFWPTEFSRLRLQGAADLADWRPGPDWSLMLAFEFAVGAHGAHPF